jgi:hypothetical protein
MTREREILGDSRIRADRTFCLLELELSLSSLQMSTRDKSNKDEAVQTVQVVEPLPRLEKVRTTILPPPLP